MAKQTISENVSADEIIKIIGDGRRYTTALKIFEEKGVRFISYSTWCNLDRADLKLKIARILRDSFNVDKSKCGEYSDEFVQKWRYKKQR